MCNCLRSQFVDRGFFFVLKSLVTNLVRGDIKLLKPLLIVRGDDVGVRSGRLGVAKLDVVDWFFEYRFCFSFRRPRRTCEPVTTVEVGGGDGGIVISGWASSVFGDVVLYCVWRRRVFLWNIIKIRFVYVWYDECVCLYDVCVNERFFFFFFFGFGLFSFRSVIPTKWLMWLIYYWLDDIAVDYFRGSFTRFNFEMRKNTSIWQRISMNALNDLGVMALLIKLDSTDYSA